MSEASHCRSCGAGISSPASPCASCGLDPRWGKAFCPSCGKAVPNPAQLICLSCGVGLARQNTSTIDASDMAYRAAGGMMILSGAWNMFMSAVWFVSLIWVCVGAFWLIPGLMSLGYLALGVYMVATGRQLKIAAFAPLLGLAISLMNLNILGGSIDMLALVLGIVGFAQTPRELEG